MCCGVGWLMLCSVMVDAINEQICLCKDELELLGAGPVGDIFVVRLNVHYYEGTRGHPLDDFVERVSGVRIYGKVYGDNYEWFLTIKFDLGSGENSVTFPNEVVWVSKTHPKNMLGRDINVGNFVEECREFPDKVSASAEVFTDGYLRLFISSKRSGMIIIYRPLDT